MPVHPIFRQTKWAYLESNQNFCFIRAACRSHYTIRPYFQFSTFTRAFIEVCFWVSSFLEEHRGQNRTQNLSGLRNFFPHHPRQFTIPLLSFMANPRLKCGPQNLHLDSHPLRVECYYRFTDDGLIEPSEAGSLTRSTNKTLTLEPHDTVKFKKVNPRNKSLLKDNLSLVRF